LIEFSAGRPGEYLSGTPSASLVHGLDDKRFYSDGVLWAWMSWEPTLYSLLSLAAGGISAVIVIAGWRHRSEPAAPAFLGLMAALAGWSVVYGVQLGFPTADAQLGWQRIALPIGGMIPTLWFLFAVQYTKRDDWLTRPALAVAAAEPVAFWLLNLTNPTHGLVWSGATLVAGEHPVLLLSLAPGYFLHITYAYLLIAAGLWFIGAETVRSTVYRTQAGLLVLGTLPPFVANIAFTLRLDVGPLPAVDFTPIAFTITGVFFGLALFQFDVLERIPVARRRVLSETDDGFIVLDEDDRIITHNRTAGRILDAPAEGTPLRAALADDGRDIQPDVTDIDGETLNATVDGTRRVYDVTCSPLSDRHDRDVGHVVRFRDITDRDRYQQRLEVANRVLRHNLRNKMNVIRGWGEQIQADPERSAEAARRIVRTADELIDLGQKARTMVETGNYVGGDARSVNVADCVGPLLDRVRQEYPSATVEADVPSELTVGVPDPELLDTALWNVVENAVKHNDADRPLVRVTAEPASTVELADGGGSADEEYVQIRVADNGPGIPAVETAVLQERTETPMRHGAGVGLWLVSWSLAAAGGEVAFERDEPRGSVVTLLLPPAETS